LTDFTVCDMLVDRRLIAIFGILADHV